MHRELTVSREIKLIKNKFELLEKSRQFRSVLQKSNTTHLGSIESNDELSSCSNGVNESGEMTTTDQIAGPNESSTLRSSLGGTKSKQTSRKRVIFNLGRVKFLGKLLSSFHELRQRGLFRRRPNRVSTVSIVEPAESANPDSMTAHEYVEDYELQASKHEQLDTSETENLADK